MRSICVLTDEKRFLIGDDIGNLTIWNENGNLISNLKYHSSSIVSIVKFLDSKMFQNYVAVSSIDKCLSVSCFLLHFFFYFCLNFLFSHSYGILKIID